MRLLLPRPLTSLAALLVALALITGCATSTSTSDSPPDSSNSESPGAPTGEDPDSDSEGPPAPEPEPRRTGPPQVISTIASNLAVPWGIAFLPNGTALVTERDSRRLLHISPRKKGEAKVREVAVLDQARPHVEAGLLGIAVSPNFSDDRQIFIYLTADTDNRVLTTRYRGGKIGQLTPILTGIPKGAIHDGGRLIFGPDGYLYVSTGDSGDVSHSQELSSLGGKILRITPDGQPAPDNPDPASPVWSFGHRNVQGLAFDDAEQLWASEFGQDDWDELNLIEPGNNYGWPHIEGIGNDERFVDPQQVWRPADASPSGLAFMDGNLWMASLRGQRLWRIQVKDGQAVRPKAFYVGDYGRMRTVTPAPDGTLWVTTSNRDGRGNPAAADDRILQVQPWSY